MGNAMKNRNHRGLSGRNGLAVVAIICGFLCVLRGENKPATLQTPDLALPQDGHHPRDFLARLADLAGVLELLRHRLAPQREQVLALLFELVLQVLGGRPASMMLGGGP